MTEETTGLGRVVSGGRSVLFGSADPRLRATWRFLLAWPLLPAVGAVVALVMPVLGASGMIVGGPLQALFLLVLVVPWARYVDRRPLSDYGVSASWPWLLDLFVGAVAATAVWAGWYALASSLGWVGVEPSMTAPQDSLAAGVVGTFVSLLVNTWVQDVVFFGIALAGAAEGLRSRGVGAPRAVLGGWVAGVAFFTAIHGTPTTLDLVGTAFGGAVFGLLYVHTGSLALTIGFHGGGSFVVTSIFTPEQLVGAFPSVFQVTKSMPDEAAVLGRLGPYLVTYLLLVGWVWSHHGTVGVAAEIAEWNERG